MEDRLSEDQGDAKRSTPISRRLSSSRKPLKFHVKQSTGLFATRISWPKGRARANLVSAKTLPQLWDRHFADSAQILRLAPDANVWLDLGSGAGFPGLVIAILQANHANFRMHLGGEHRQEVRVPCRGRPRHIGACGDPLHAH